MFEVMEAFEELEEDVLRLEELPAMQIWLRLARMGRLDS